MYTEECHRFELKQKAEKKVREAAFRALVHMHYSTKTRCKYFYKVLRNWTLRVVVKIYDSAHKHLVIAKVILTPDEWHLARLA